MEKSTVDERVVTDRARLASRRRWKAGTRQVYEAALDSIAPESALVAHVGSVPYASTCIGPQVRIYVTERLTVQPSAFAEVARREIERQYSRVTVSRSDSAGWTISRLAWTDSKTDFIHPGTLEIWYRQLGSRSVILGVMDAWSAKIDAAAFLGSIR
jgi:hypothetical protein